MYHVQGYDEDGALDDEECETLEDAEQILDQMVLDGATKVEVLNGYGDVIFEYDENEAEYE